MTGHSVGGGAAVLCALELCGNKREAGSLFPLLAAGHLKVYAFAPPPLFARLAQVPPMLARSTFSFVLGSDCVPRASTSAVLQAAGALSADFPMQPISRALPSSPSLTDVAPYCAFRSC